MFLAKKKHRAALCFPFTHLFSVPRKGSELIQSSGERNRENTEDLRMSMVGTPAGIGLNTYKGLRRNGHADSKLEHKTTVFVQTGYSKRL